MKHYLLLLSLAMLTMISCRKDDLTPGDKVIVLPDPTITVEVDGQGFVYDENGNAIEGASVTLGLESVLTDEYGYFNITALAGADLAMFKVTADGYYNAFPAINPIVEKTHEVRVKLKEKTLTTSLPSNLGGDVQLPNGSNVNFAANSFEKMDGSPYTGDVNLYAYYLDPTSADLYETMPGNLSAVDQNSDVQILQSFAMMNVELESTSGEILQINKDAELTFAIPANLSANAPGEIPLWYFDENSGYWIEEGKATLTNGQYIGEVSHFTFWNCDVPSDFINLSGQVVDPRADGVFQVCVTQNATDITICTATTLDGFFEGFVPNDESLTIEIFDHCKTAIYSSVIGPFSSNTDIGIISVSANNNVSQISGTVVKCDGTPLSNGRVFIKLNNDALSQMVTVESDGSFSTLIATCNSTEIIIKALDLEDLVESDPITYTVTNTINTGVLMACGNQITIGAEFDFSPDYYKLITPLLLTNDQNGQDSFRVFNFEFTDDLGGGNKVTYNYTIINWSNDPVDPLYAFAYDVTIIGTPSEVLEVNGGEINALQTGSNIGDQVIFEIPSTTLLVTDQGTGAVETFFAGKITLTGIIE